MNTYIIKEQAFAGSITIGISVYGIAAESFNEAKDKLKAIVKEKGGEDSRDDDNDYSYSLPCVCGSMQDKPLEMLP